MRRSVSWLSKTKNFIEVAAEFGIGALEGRKLGTGGGYDRGIGEDVMVTKIRGGGGEVECTMTISSHHVNAFGTLHGGCVATLIDCVGTLALLSLDHRRPGVSVELNSSFLRPAPLGSRIRISASVLKYGKRLGYTQVHIFNAADEIIAVGRHTKAFS